MQKLKSKPQQKRLASKRAKRNLLRSQKRQRIARSHWIGTRNSSTFIWFSKRKELERNAKRKET